MNSLLGKIFGWLQFGVQAISGVSQNGGAPHGWAGWLSLISSLAAAIGIHAATNVGKVVPSPTTTTHSISGSSHIQQ